MADLDDLLANTSFTTGGKSSTASRSCPSPSGGTGSTR